MSNNDNSNKRLEELAASGDTNILKTDVELSALIKRLEDVKKYKSFQKWKSKFLDRLDQYLYAAGHDPAEKASKTFDASLKKMVKSTTKVHDLMEKGDLSETKKTVKASLALNEMCNKLTVLNDEVETIIPFSRAEEKKRGFTKFHLGAVLIQQGFTQYVTMEVIRDALADIGTKLEHVADRQQHDLFYYYQKQVIRFCDIMADLNLYEIMKKCIEFATPPDEEESSSEEEPLTIQVVIETYDGKTMRLELDPSETIGNVKDAIAPGCGIEPDEQVLQFDASTLDDNDVSLAGVGVVDGATLWLEPRNVTVNIAMPDGTTHPIKLSLDDTEVEIKKRIAVQLGMPAEQQVLEYNGTEIPGDGKTVRDLSIQEGDTINVGVLEVPITVTTMDGKTIDVMVNPKKPLSEIKKKLEEETGLPVDNQNLFLDGDTLDDDDKPAGEYGIKAGTKLDLEPKKIKVSVEMPDGTKVPVDLKPSDTADTIKEKIAEQTGMEVPKQVLKFNGKELPSDDGKTVKDLGIREGDDLKVDVKKIPISVTNTMDGKKIDLMIDPTEPIGEIKKQVADKSGVPVNNQRLSKDGEELEDDDKTAEDYGIEAGAELDMEPRIIKVNVEMPDGKKHVVELTPHDTSDDIKEKIADKTGMKAPRQVVKHKGNELPKDGSTVKDMGIREDDDLQVEIFKVPITVSTMDGKKIKVMIDPTEKLGEIKKQLEDESGVPADNQRLFKDGEELDDEDKTAEDCGIEADSELDMEPKIIKVNVEMPDGTKHEVDVTPSDTSDDIKDKIEKQTGMAAPRQVVQFNGEELPTDGKTVKDMGIREGDDLKVDIKKVPITATTIDDDKIDLMVDPTEPISEIKKQVADKSGVPVDNQRIFMNGEELEDDDKPAQDYGIEAGTELDMEPKIIKVNVEMPDGEKHIVELTPRDSSDDIKDKIEKQTGMEAPRQVVKHKGNELPKDGSTVKDMGIREDDDLQVEIFKVPITVSTMDGKKIKVMIDPTEKLGEIKKQLEDESGVPADNQRLFKDGEELDDDDKTAQDYGIEADAELDMEPKIIKVNVEMPDGTKHEVDVTPSDTSDDIKDKIEKQTGMAAPRQVVQFNGEELPTDGKTVKDMGIREGDDLKVDIKKVPITVTTIDGDKIDLMVDPTEPISEIKKQVADKSGVPVDNQRIFMNGEELEDDDKPAQDYGIEAGTELDMEPKIIKVNVEMPDGEKHEIEISPRDTSDDIKDKIEKQTGMAAPRQVVQFKDKELPTDGTTVKDMGIREGDDLKVDIKKVPITVTTIDGDKIDLMVDPTEPISEIKKQLSDKSGVPVDNQRIFMNGEELDDDDKPAQDYGIEAGTELDMEPKIIKVNVEMPDGTKHEVDVTPSDTSDDIKDKIEKQTGMAAPRQVVQFNGEELPTDGKTVKDMGIREGDDLKLDIRKIPIAVTTIDGDKIDLMVDPTEPISEIKKQVADKSGVPVDNQRIFMNGEELEDDDKPAQDYGIEAGTELDMEPKIIKVNVEMPDGTTHSVDISPSDTSNDIKDKIEKQTGMAAPRQVVQFKGKELPTDGTTVKDMGIREGDDLKVDIKKVPITVTTMDGEKIKLKVDPTEPISEIKKQVAEESGVPVDNQRLFMNGEELDDDDKPAQDYGIEAGTELDMEPKIIKVNVEMPDGTTHTVDLAPSDTSGDVKDKIEKQTGMAAPRQVVTFKGNLLPNNGTTVKDMGIREGNDLKVDIKKVPITVTTMDGDKINLMIDPTEPISEIKKQVAGESGVPAKNQRLSKDGEELDNDGKAAQDFGIEAGSELDMEPKVIKVNVAMPDGEKHEVEISPRDTSDEVKEKIAKKTGMEVPRQVVKFEGNELPKDGTNVRDIGIRDGDDLDVEIFKVPITVNTMDGKTIKAMIDPTDKLSDIKKQLEEESGIAPNNQRLFKDGVELANDNKKAEDYGIKAGTELDLEPKKMTVSVTMPNGKKHDVEIAPSDTAEGIKMKIAEQTGMEVPKQVLKFNGKEIPKGQTARDAGVRDGDNLDVELFRVPVTVNTMDGKTIKIMVDPTDKIIAIKKLLEEESGLHPANQRLYKQADELADDNRAAQGYGIEAGSVLDLEPRSFSVNVEMPDKSKHSILLAPSDTNEEVKEKIEKATGMAVPRQVVKFNGKEIPGFGKKVRDMGMREGSDLKVGIFKIPISVKTHEDKIIPLKIEPIDTIATIKNMIEKETDIPPSKQVLKLGEKELNSRCDKMSATECGIKKDSELTVEPLDDPIVFVDILSETLFAVDREDVIQRGALTPRGGNKLDFTEAANDSATKEKLGKAMKDAPHLGVATQVVVQAIEVEDYDLAEAEKVKSKWGVNLKKRTKNKKGEEFIFVDPKTGAVGELSRKKYVEMGFITPAPPPKGNRATEVRDFINESEKDTEKYDKYRNFIREIYGIKVSK